MKRYLYLTESGFPLAVNPSDDTLRDLQAMVDGYVERVHIPGRVRIPGTELHAWVNEEGLFRRDFGTNRYASIWTGRSIVGPAVIATTEGGRTVGLTPEMISGITFPKDIRDNDGKGYPAQLAAEMRFAPFSVEVRP